MPRYHFNVYDGVTLPDEKGKVLPDLQAVRLEAIRLAGEVLKSNALRIAVGEDWRMEVADELGLVLFRLDFNVMEAPATIRQRSH